MPRGDGTGPQGQGPMTGRGKGRCGGGKGQQDGGGRPGRGGGRRQGGQGQGRNQQKGSADR